MATNTVPETAPDDDEDIVDLMPMQTILNQRLRPADAIIELRRQAKGGKAWFWQRLRPVLDEDGLAKLQCVNCEELLCPSNASLCPCCVREVFAMICSHHSTLSVVSFLGFQVFPYF